MDILFQIIKQSYLEGNMIKLEQQLKILLKYDEALK
jgi:hypothetical protein